ncbi:MULTISPECIES: MFS transporter [unclassified Arthrobacter]|uniref:MFS transporter n=1 Tax=unclassified Arthrobacter TaxID=235627 RepID=UPI002DFA2B0D|nr:MULTISPECIES: MFS transporter [unclassified Arthrobacter]MEC5193276.1 MHS family metabolite:H+ symporter-like MFS transporter [Arthrobacter sp. MP_M4]MEC5204751.1 MHS family metabolite:H+ symporter-like MFS transporter [Arthrobacter sp. MP_M7]
MVTGNPNLKYAEASPQGTSLHPEVSPAELRRTSISSWLGSALEYMDFTLYTLAAALVFGPLFFPNNDPAMALLASFAAYGSGFLVRPLGGIYFGYLGDKYGRKSVLVITVGMMGVATLGMGLLPTFAQIGVGAPILLVLLRLIQGFGAGAELSGASLLLVESAPVGRRGFYGAVVALGTSTGVLLASGLWLLLSQMPKEDFLVWGWRVPFLLSVVTTLVALYLRRSISESPVFEAVKARRAEARAEARQQSVWRDAADAKKSFLVSLGIKLGENGSVYLVKGFLIGWTVSVVKIDANLVTTGVTLGSILGIATVLLTGKLTDRLGRRKVWLWLSGFQFVFTVPAMLMIETRNPVLVTLVFVIFLGGPLPNMYGVESTWLVEMFGSKRRFSFMTTVKELGAALSGGLGPILAAAVVVATGPGWVPVAGILMSYAAIGWAAGLFAPETRGRDLNSEADAF